MQGIVADELINRMQRAGGSRGAFNQISKLAISSAMGFYWTTRGNSTRRRLNAGLFLCSAGFFIMKTFDLIYITCDAGFASTLAYVKRWRMSRLIIKLLFMRVRYLLIPILDHICDFLFSTNVVAHSI